MKDLIEIKEHLISSTTKYDMAYTIDANYSILWDYSRNLTVSVDHYTKAELVALKYEMINKIYELLLEENITNTIGYNLLEAYYLNVSTEETSINSHMFLDTFDNDFLVMVSNSNKADITIKGKINEYFIQLL